MGISQSENPLYCCIDLFCGCGGNSWGLRREAAFRPINPLLALDWENSAIKNYRRNMPSTETIQEDIREVSPREILKRIGISAGELGMVVASPPCQTYSRNNRNPKDIHDQRNTLYIQTLEIVKTIKPWVVLMENVPEMEKCGQGEYHKEFISKITNYGYDVGHWVVDAADYGVPQHRKRLIYLAYSKKMNKKPVCPPKTHGNGSGLLRWITVADALKDLPLRKAGQGPDWFFVDEIQKEKRSPYALGLLPKTTPVSINHAARELNPIQIERLKILRSGQDMGNLPERLQPNQGYKSSYGRLWSRKPAPTLTTYLAYPGSGRFSHYRQDRTITIREALRLQSFDDDFWVFGSLIEQSTMVGNAVPPLLALAFRKMIVADLEKISNKRE